MDISGFSELQKYRYVGDINATGKQQQGLLKN